MTAQPQNFETLETRNARILSKFSIFDLVELSDEQIQRGEGTPSERFWSKVAITADDQRCWNWKKSGSKYGKVTYKQKQYLATHFVWFLTYGYFPSLWMLHSCDNPKCVNPNHLREGTPKDNVRDMAERNRMPRGEQKPNSKLRKDDVVVIKRLLNQKVSQRKIASQFQVSQSVIQAINARKEWKHI